MFDEELKDEKVGVAGMFFSNSKKRKRLFSPEGQSARRVLTLRELTAK